MSRSTAEMLEGQHLYPQLPEEVWTKIASFMSMEHWAMASGTCRTTDAVRLTAANLPNSLKADGDPLMLPILQWHLLHYSQLLSNFGQSDFHIKPRAAILS